MKVILIVFMLRICNTKDACIFIYKSETWKLMLKRLPIACAFK